jgi:hypothetical protein
MMEYCSAIKKNELGTGVHTCNPSYSGGRDQEAQFEVTQANTLRDPILKKNV